MLKLNKNVHKSLLEILDDAHDLAEDNRNLQLGIEAVERELKRADIYRNLAVIKFNDRTKIQQCIVVLNKVLEMSEDIEKVGNYDTVTVDIIVTESLLKLYELL